MALAHRTYSWTWDVAFAPPAEIDAKTHAVIVKLVAEALASKGATAVEVEGHIRSFVYDHKRVLGDASEGYAPRYAGSMAPGLVADLDARFCGGFDIEVDLSGAWSGQGQYISPGP